MFKEKLKQTTNKITPKKESILRLLPFIGFMAVFFGGYHFFGNNFSEVMWLAMLTLIAISLALIMIMAGFVVLEALFFVAAEISLLIFLAQAYCNVPHSTQGNAALQSLIAIGLIYIVAAFGHKLWNILSTKYKEAEKEPRSKEEFGAITLFVFFTIFVLWEIYLVINPIIRDLCIYK